MAKKELRTRRIILVIVAAAVVAAVVAVSIARSDVNIYALIGCILLFLAILGVKEFLYERKRKR